MLWFGLWFVVAEVGCGDSPSASSANSQAMANVCRQADLFTDSCGYDSSFTWGRLSDNDYACRSLKAECQAKCVLAHSKNCDELKTNSRVVPVGGAGATTPSGLRNLMIPEVPTCIDKCN
jgi:hypothetical protein